MIGVSYMKKIKLQNNTYTLIDNVDYNLVSKHKWHYCIKRNKKYVRTNIIKNKKITVLYLHRLILDAKKGQYVDHINGNPLDNRRKNLRICTNQQNLTNAGPQKNNKSGYRGVYWAKSNRKWCAQITHKGNRISLGYFTNKKSAAKAYNKAALDLRGEYAKLNKI